METARQQQFMKEYNAWNQGDVGGSLSLGNTSKFLQDLGVSQGNVYWDKAKIVASKKNHQDLTDGVMKQVPQLLDDPLLVMQSKTGAKRFAFIDNVLDDQGKPMLAALVLEPTGAGNRVVKFTKIPGVDVRYNALEGLKQSGDVLYQKPGKSMSGMEVQASSTQWSEGRRILDDRNEKYIGGRTREELEKLADDPAHAGSKRQIDIDKGIHEREVGLGVEKNGKIKGPITRDPSGKAEFFDADGQAWDVKSFNSNYNPRKGGYTLQKSMDEIYDSLGKNENVILDTTNLSEAHRVELLKEISEKGLSDHVIVWP